MKNMVRADVTTVEINVPRYKAKIADISGFGTDDHLLLFSGYFSGRLCGRLDRALLCDSHWYVRTNLN